MNDEGLHALFRRFADWIGAGRKGRTMQDGQDERMKLESTRAEYIRQRDGLEAQIRYEERQLERGIEQRIDGEGLRSAPEEWLEQRRRELRELAASGRGATEAARDRQLEWLGKEIARLDAELGDTEPASEVA